MTATPRQRAQAALDVIIDAPLPNMARVELAYRQLAEAMNALFGPLPSEGLTLAHISPVSARPADCGSQGRAPARPLASSPPQTES